MKSLNFKIILITLLVFLVACKKDVDDTIVEGTVLDKTTKQPLQGVTVELLEGGSSCLLANWYPKGKGVTITITNVNGNYKFNLETKCNDFYGLMIGKKELYYDYSHQGTCLPRIEPCKKNFPVYELEPKAFLKIHLKNISKKYNLIYLYETCENYKDEYIGYDIDDTFFYCGNNKINDRKGNTYNKIFYSFYIGNLQYDSVFCPSFDTTLYNLNY